MFTASRTQFATYLLGVVLFSISFLVFLNSSVSFVITDILGWQDGVGDAVGTLGFADELLALFACPFWGLLSDRIGFSTVSALGYGIVGISLFVFVHATNVYPGLLFARLFFALGGAATATMVTAILPSMTKQLSQSVGEAVDGHIQPRSESVPEAHATSPGSPNGFSKGQETNRNSHTRLAGVVGTFAGAGALIALTCFLPLPAQFSKLHVGSAKALQYTFYVVGSFALVVAVVCLVGLRGLQGEEHKSWRRLWQSTKDEDITARGSDAVIAYRKLFFESLRLGGQDPSIALAYLGGWVARASSVGITLFIPLYVNHYFHSTGLCDTEDPTEVKRQCKDAYLLAAKLTGISQLVALLCAPIYGLVDHRFPRYHVGLLVSTISGIVGYTGLAAIKTPDPSRRGGTSWIYPVIILIGISQIGAIVCSLGLLGRAIASPSAKHESPRRSAEDSYAEPRGDDNLQDDETSRLMATVGPSTPNRHRLQGSVAGVYSLCGGAGILVLTKLGGLMFDRTSPGSPFYMMAIFNAVLLVGTIATTTFRLLPLAFGKKRAGGDAT